MVPGGDPLFFAFNRKARNRIRSALTYLRKKKKMRLTLRTCEDKKGKLVIGVWRL